MSGRDFARTLVSGVQSSMIDTYLNRISNLPDSLADTQVRLMHACNLSSCAWILGSYLPGCSGLAASAVHQLPSSAPLVFIPDQRRLHTPCLAYALHSRRTSLQPHPLCSLLPRC